MANAYLIQKSNEWIKKYGAAAVKACEGTGIFPLTILAQSSIESNWGTSKLTTMANNFYGIKTGSKWTGKSVVMKTAEQTKTGAVYYVDAPFRAWDTPEQGFKGIIDFLKSNPRYAAAFTAPTPAAQIAAIHKSGYATDIKYTTTNVTRQDVMKSLMPSLSEKKKINSNPFKSPSGYARNVFNNLSNFILG